MKEADALQLMVPPSRKRPGKAFGGTIQILTTRACDRACHGCTQGCNFRGHAQPISLDHFDQACRSLFDYWGVVGVFGGNPTLHPKFGTICSILRQYVPWDRRGIWANRLFGQGRVVQATFNPSISNVNVHLDGEAAQEFHREWPRVHVYGVNDDSRHAPPFIAMCDLVHNEGRRGELVSQCDINQHWSAMIGEFRGELRAWFCEIAGAQSILHQSDPDYPDTGVPVVPGWWNQPIEYYANQVRKHCHECGIPLRGYGDLACDPNGVDYVSCTHASVCIPKLHSGVVRTIEHLDQLRTKNLPAHEYLQGAKK